jgi:isoquinoline 1-oxidoreductase alpha subunit
LTALPLNGQPTSFDGDATMPLLWVVREQAGLTGAKFGYSLGICGARTVHVNGPAARSSVV